MKANSVVPLRRVNSERAHLVASAFAAAPSISSDPKVGAAYAELSEQARGLFARLTTDYARRPVRVVFTRCREPYSDAQELSQSVRFDQVLEVVSAAHERDRQHPLLEASDGGAHDCLRTVHDIVSHGWLRYPFDRDGEYSAWHVEHRMYWPGDWRRSCTRSTACSGRPVDSPSSRRHFSPLISSAPP